MTIRTRLLFLLLPSLTLFVFFNSLFFYFQWSREFLLMGSCVILTLLTGTVVIIAERISQPVRQLNQRALDIAAGNYEANIQVEGPREITELAHTLNTMNQCLVEHMSRLKESSLIRERMYGEYECSLLLQYYMLQKVIEDFRDPRLNLRLISLPHSPLHKGLLLKIDQSIHDQLNVTLLEASDSGFAGLFELNHWTHLSKDEFKNKSFIECKFIDGYRQLRYDAKELFPPLIWSVKDRCFIKHQKNHASDISLEDLDMVFLYNSSIIEHFEKEELIEEWFAKVLRHFAEAGLDTIHMMLTNELMFLAKKQHIKHSFKIIGIQKQTKTS